MDILDINLNGAEPLACVPRSELAGLRAVEAAARLVIVARRELEADPHRSPARHELEAGLVGLACVLRALRIVLNQQG